MRLPSPPAPGPTRNAVRPARPGWYPDPDLDHPERWRWWDGAAWTDWLASHQHAPMPAAVRRRLEPRPGPAEPRSLVRFAVIWAVLLITLTLIALAVFGQGRPRETSGNEPAPTAFGTPAPAIVAWQQEDHSVTVKGAVELAVPTTLRYTYGPKSVAGVFTRLAQWTLRTGPDDTVLAVLADIDPVLQTGSPADTGRSVLKANLRNFEAKQVIPTEPVITPVPGIPDAVQLTARVELRGAKNGRDTHYDVVIVIVPYQSPQGDGQALWLASTPADTPAEVRAALEQSRGQIRRR